MIKATGDTSSTTAREALLALSAWLLFEPLEGDDRFGRWTLATAAPSQIRSMATYFGVTYSKDGQQINHSLSTAIIGTDGRLISLMADNDWKPADAIDIIRRAARGGSK